MIKLQLGNTANGPLELSPKVLQRHFACFGSSGSGKTVACKVMIEELARNGIPVIAFDPQGDIASLAILEDEKELQNKSLDPSLRTEMAENVEVVIWTPASSKGIPLCINPLKFDGVEKMNNEDKSRYLSSTAKNIVSLIGYDLETDDGKSAESILYTIFEDILNNGQEVDDFNDIILSLKKIPKSVESVISAISTPKLVKTLIKKLSLLTVGARKLLFQTGVPASIESLLGLDMQTGKTRISVIYLNTLSTTEEKEFFIGSITQLLYRWMLKNPPEDNFDSIQCAMFIDEIAPYIPPVRKPACKTSLELLFRQGRKYGVSCLIATQSPGDIDYKAIGQFSTFTLGALNTDQDIKKVKKRVESLAPKEVDFITGQMPALKPGQFLVVSPDEYESVQELQVRWLVTKHPLVISESKIANLIQDDIRSYYLNEVISTEEVKDHKSEKNKKEKIKKVDSVPISDPSPELQDGILCVENKIFERDLEDIIKPHLEGTIFKSEKFVSAKFQYLPLIQVNLIYLKERGLFRKRTEEIPENLYLDYKNMDMLYVDKKHIKFDSVIDIDPDKIIDLDNICEIKAKPGKELDFDKRKLGKKMDLLDIKQNMERKYKVNVLKAELVLFPVWICKIENKKNSKKRELCIDGIFSNEIQATN